MSSGGREASLEYRAADWVSWLRNRRETAAAYRRDPWPKRLGRWLSRDRSLQDLDERAAEARERLPDDPAVAVARLLVDRKWVAAMQQMHSVALSARAAELASVEGRLFGEHVMAAEVPGLVSVLSPQFVGDFVREESARRHLVAADQELLTKFGVLSDAKVASHWLVVQHRASGLRGRFTVQAGSEEGLVESRSYKINSIDPADAGRDDVHNWQAYVGLGIGVRLYQRAGEEWPQVRWAKGIDHARSARYSTALRRKLHAADPWRWQTGYCAWCAGQRVDWEHADRATFAGHKS